MVIFKAVGSPQLPQWQDTVNYMLHYFIIVKYYLILNRSLVKLN